MGRDADIAMRRVGTDVAGEGETLDIVPRFLITGRRVCGSSFGGSTSDGR